MTRPRSPDTVLSSWVGPGAGSPDEEAKKDKKEQQCFYLVFFLNLLVRNKTNKSLLLYWVMHFHEVKRDH